MKVVVLGGTGLLGREILKAAERRGFEKVLAPKSSELDLLQRDNVFEYFFDERPDLVIGAASVVGGIQANDTKPVDFLSKNIQIATNAIDACAAASVARYVNIAASCVYPKLAPQPISEDSFLDGVPEVTNRWYTIAKAAALMLCQAYNKQYGLRYITLVPPNLYGYGDDFHSEDSHVIPALIRKFYEAKRANSDEVVIWGSGSPVREFMFAEDAGAVIVDLAMVYEEAQHLNIGSGQHASIAEIAGILKLISGFEGQISFDLSKTDGAPKKVLSLDKFSKIYRGGFTSLHEGLSSVYEFYTTEVAQ